jgi:ferrous iron transport protein A
MLDMGLVSGSEVEVLRVAPLDDPIGIMGKGYNLTLRRA